MLLAEGSTFAGYTIVRRLGTGGMGEVYLARHPRLPRQDALKILRAEVSADTEYRERFNREANVAASLWHPHIVAIHDRGEYNGQLWIDMDFVDGTDAGQMLRDIYPSGMPGAEVTEIIAAVAEALDYAHQHRLLHRDVKPANILLAQADGEERRILLADFGIAGWVDDPSGLTATNMTVGTVYYAAPEQLMGHDLDGRADQYALAATAFHLLTGSPPFQHSNPAVVISQHLSAPPPTLGDRQPGMAELDPVFAKALAKDPMQRYERCIDFARALGHRLGTGDPDATRVLMPRAAAAPARRSLMRAAVLVPAVLAALLVAAIAAAAFEFRRADDELAELPTTTHTASTDPTTPPHSATPQDTATSQVSAAPTNSTTTSAKASAIVAIGARCAPIGSVGVTKTGATAYCVRLQGTSRTVWSLTENDAPSPTVTIDPTETSLPTEQESPIRMCMQQTGQTLRECLQDIRRSDGRP